MTETKKGFKNWCENIENKNALIYYPVDNNEIRNLISTAKDDDEKIRIVGSHHSASPVICKSDEKVMLVSLHKYHLDPDDIIINDDTVMVNAGWTLGQLYDHLNINKYFLDTQPASSAFTIGGIITMPVHGSRLGASLISDSLTEITLINMKGEYIKKTEKDNDFNLYKNSLGIFGIITSATFKIQRIENFHIHVKRHFDIFQDDGHINRAAVDSKFKELVTACFDSSNVKYHHSFMDFQNNCWTTIDWIATDKKPKIYIDTPEINEIKMVNVVEFHKYIVPNYRKNKTYLKALGKIYTFSIIASIKKNSLEDHDMFWVTTATRVLFMSYFIPIHTEGEDIDLTKLYTALEIIMDTVNKARTFNIDFPSDIRFVVSSDKSPLSPIFKTKKTVYLAIDITCSAANISFPKKSRGLFDFIYTDNHTELNEDFRKFYSRIEHKWVELGGIPHFAKMFGFIDAKQNPFDPVQIGNIFSPETKKILQENAQPLFVNSFVKKLII